MEKRVCNTCGMPRSKSSFACHYDSHTEICHACKDFCIHRVKLAHSKGVTVHDLFSGEADPARLRRYRALTKAGVVWEQVARRQHSTRKRAAKRRRASSPATAAPQTSAATPSAPKRRRHTVTVKRRRATSGAAPSSRAAAAPAAAADLTETTLSFASKDAHVLVDDAASIASSGSESDSAVSAGSRSPLPSMAMASDEAAQSQTAAAAAAAPWQFFGDFDEAVEALMTTGHDLGASAHVDEAFTATLTQLDAAAPPLFDSDVTLDERMLALDTNMLVDSLSACDWDCVAALPSPSQQERDAAAASGFFNASVAACM